MAFTTVSDIEDTLGTTLTAAQQTQAGFLITAATGAIREAAGSNITETTATVELEGHNERKLHVPLQPLTAVTSVQIDGEAVTDWTQVGQALWRSYGWTRGVLWRPAVVTLALTYGHATVPAPVRTLTEHLVAAGLAQTVDGTLGSPPNIAAEGLGEWSVTYRDDGPVHVLQLPDDTRGWLRRTYGPATTTVRSR